MVLTIRDHKPVSITSDVCNLASIHMLSNGLEKSKWVTAMSKFKLDDLFCKHKINKK